ncbi:MAG: hypothetical protein REI78_09435 [Pedobacter sp.]|nr:hypothetical protein [Pedobacter sp.]
MPVFETIYFLENFYLYIIEVKINGLPENADASEKFKWLRIDKETLEITGLTFRSMDSGAELEERYFEEGFLKFNQDIGTYIEKYNSAQHPLDNRKDFKVPTLLYNAIEAYLKGNPFTI